MFDEQGKEFQVGDERELVASSFDNRDRSITQSMPYSRKAKIWRRMRSDSNDTSRTCCDARNDSEEESTSSDDEVFELLCTPVNDQERESRKRLRNQRECTFADSIFREGERVEPEALSDVEDYDSSLYQPTAMRRIASFWDMEKDIGNEVPDSPNSITRFPLFRENEVTFSLPNLSEDKTPGLFLNF